MSIFWLEYLHFIAAMVAIVVSISAFALFLLTYQYERQMRTVWRSTGFFLLAVGFFLFVLERKFGFFAMPAILVATMGFFSIYKGVLSEPNLAHLKKAKKIKDTPKVLSSMLMLLWISVKRYFVYLVGLAIFFLLFGLGYLLWPATFSYLGSFFPALFELVALVLIVLTIRIQIRRYKTEGAAKDVKRQNLWPLLGYIFLAVRGIAYFLHRLPDMNVVTLHNIGLDFSFMWQLGVYGTLLGFIFLGIWAWNFIKLRPFLRTYVDFLTIAIVVSTLGALVFTTLVFQIVEKNNLKLMAQGAETEHLIFVERANNALFIASTMASDAEIVNNVRNNSYEPLLNRATEYLDNSNLDVLRVYNKYGEVVVSPGDERERGRVFSKDNLVAFALTEKKVVKSFETQEGVLSPILVARSLHPLTVGNTVIGVVEAGYVFDNAFVDYSKDKTGLDVTIYAGNKRAATTILTQDGVSRWVGSEETNSDVITTVLEDGEQYRSVVDRLGLVYYAAFEPVKDVNGEIIGMVSVGAPTQVLFEETRQQLVSSFLIVTIISLIAAWVGYYMLFSVRRRLKEKF